MNYSLNILNKAIDKWIAKAYSESPNKEYAVEYLYKKYLFSDKFIKEKSNKTILKITNECYHLYSLGNYKAIQYLFSNDYKLCDFFSKEELIDFLNKKIIINTTPIIVKMSEDYDRPPQYKLVDDSFKKEIYKFCRGTIISKEILRKLKSIPEFKIEEKNNPEENIYQIKNDTIPDTITNMDDEEKEEINIFCKTMPLKIPIEHFKVFTLNKSSNNGKPFLDEKSFDLFIRKAFIGELNIETLLFNFKVSSEKLLIQEVFYDFYNKYQIKYFPDSNTNTKFIELLTENFVGWNFKTIQRKFKPNIIKKLTPTSKV